MLLFPCQYLPSLNVPWRPPLDREHAVVFRDGLQGFQRVRRHDRHAAEVLARGRGFVDAVPEHHHVEGFLLCGVSHALIIAQAGRICPRFHGSSSLSLSLPCSPCHAQPNPAVPGQA